MIAQRHAPSAKLCLRVFVQLLEVRESDDAIVRASLMGIDRLLPVLDDAAKREALLWVIKTVLKHEGSDVCDGLLDLLLRHGEAVIPQTEEVCRIMTQRYAALSQSTRLTLLLLLVKLVRLDAANAQVRKMFDYVLELNAKDVDVEVRVQARNIRAVGPSQPLTRSSSPRRTPPWRRSSTRSPSPTTVPTSTSPSATSASTTSARSPSR